MLIFSHPDFTVGSGITPDQLLITGHGLSGFASIRRCAILHRHSQPESPSVGNLQFNCITLPRRIPFLFYIPIVCTLSLYVNTKFCIQNFARKIYSFIVSWIRCFFRSTLITFTSTISPTLTTSRGCLINFSLICEMCTSPS